jgi:hypothetical protein
MTEAKDADDRVLFQRRRHELAQVFAEKIEKKIHEAGDEGYRDAKLLGIRPPGNEGG